jgi:flagellar protein FliO/FliZ
MDTISLLKSLIALGVVISLIVLFAIIAKKFNLDKLLHNNFNQSKTLKIEESLIIDSKRKLLLVKNGNKKHLILITATNNLIIETNIIDSDEKPA